MERVTQNHPHLPNQLEDWAKALVIPAIVCLLDLYPGRAQSAQVDSLPPQFPDSVASLINSEQKIVSPERDLTVEMIRQGVPLTGRASVLSSIFNRDYGTIDLIRLANTDTEQLFIRVNSKGPNSLAPVAIPAETSRTPTGYLIKMGTYPNTVALIIPDSSEVRIDAWKLGGSNPPTFRKVEVEVNSDRFGEKRQQVVTLTPESVVPGHKTYRISSEVISQINDGPKLKECSWTIVPKLEQEMLLTERSTN